MYVPPLRERREDIPIFVGKFAKEFVERNRINFGGFRRDAIDALSGLEWPGNVRELENVVHRSVLACAGDEIQIQDLPPDMRESALREAFAEAGRPEPWWSNPSSRLEAATG